MRGRALVLGVLLLLPMVGLALLLLVPSIDLMWEHQPSHFWLVLGVALLNVVLGLLASEARQRSAERGRLPVAVSSEHESGGIPEAMERAFASIPVG